MFDRYVYKKLPVRAVMFVYDTFGGLFLARRAAKSVELPKKIAILCLNQIGDVVMAMPTISAVSAMAPEAKMTIITTSAPASLLTENQWQAEVIAFDAAWQKVTRQMSDGANEVNAAKAKLAKLFVDGNFDCLIILHPDLVVNQIAGSVIIAHIFGFANAGGGFCLTNKIWMPDSGHQVERNYALAEAFATTFGIKLPELSPPKIAVAETASKSVKAKLEEEKIDTTKIVILHPFASAVTKNWDFARWQEVAEWLIYKKLTPIIIGGKNDAFPVTAGVVDWTGKLNLTETAALAARAKLFIGVDSGPAHIFAAVGAPVISVYSSAHDPLRWAPFGDKEKTIILHHAAKDRTKYPLETRELPAGTVGNPYIDEITVQEVETAASKLITAKVH